MLCMTLDKEHHRLLSIPGKMGISILPQLPAHGALRFPGGQGRETSSHTVRLPVSSVGGLLAPPQGSAQSCQLCIKYIFSF